MESATSLRNLSLALRHILQQFMETNKTGEHKNADMTLPHNGYFQRLSWYFECDNCHYRTFYVREIEAHRQICTVASGVHLSNLTIPKCEASSAMAAPTSIHNGSLADPSSIQNPVILDGLNLSTIEDPDAEAADRSALPVDDSGMDYANTQDVKRELKKYLETSGGHSSNTPGPAFRKRKRRSKKHPASNGNSSTAVGSQYGASPKPSTSGLSQCEQQAAQNSWEDFEQILVSTDGDGTDRDVTTRLGRSRKRKVSSCQRWTKEENAILNALHNTPSEMPSKEVMDKLCEALPNRSKCVIRAKASNNRKVLLRQNLDRFPDEAPLSPEANLASPDQLSDIIEPISQPPDQATEDFNHTPTSESIFPSNDQDS